MKTAADNRAASALVHSFPGQVPLFQQVSRGCFQPTTRPTRFEALLTAPDQPL